MLYRLLALTLLWPLGASAQTAPVDPLTLRTRDTHQNLTIIADPYVTADRYTKTIFGKTSTFTSEMTTTRPSASTSVRFCS
jgi:hypothetical protein